MCLKGQDTRGFGFMSLNTVQNILNQIKPKTIKASWFGESLLNPQFCEIIKYIKSKNIRVFLFTNGSLIDKKMAGFLKKYTDKIFISIDDIGEYYERIRVGLKYNSVNKAIQLLSDHNLILTAVYQSDKQIKRLKKEYPQINIVRNVDRYKKNNEVKKIICPHNVENRLVVGWDGKCYLCCEDWLGQYYIGDCIKQSIDDIWNGKLLKNYIENLEKLTICKNCTL